MHGLLKHIPIQNNDFAVDQRVIAANAGPLKKDAPLVKL